MACFFLTSQKAFDSIVHDRHTAKTCSYGFLWYITTTFVRSGNFAGTIVNVTTLFPQNLNEDKDNSFQYYFFINVKVSESFPGEMD